MKIKSLIVRICIPVFITGLALTSCKKDSSTTDNLLGTWTVNSFTTTSMVGNMEITQYMTSVLNLPAAVIPVITQNLNQYVQKAYVGTITFKSDNTFTSTLGGVADSGTWLLLTGGKKLDITSSSKSPLEFDILGLTSTKLDVKTVEKIGADLNQDGTPELIEVTINASLNK